MTNLYTNFPRLPFSLPAETMNENAKKTAQKLLDFEESFTQKLKDSGIVTMKDMTPDQQFASFVQMTDPRDFQFLMDPDYIKKLHAGLAPVLVSPRWASMLSYEALFKHVQSSFRRLMKARIPQVVSS